MTATIALYVFSASALGGGVAMLCARHPMRVALALIATMLSLACIYAALAVHVVAVFQVLIYVGAVMVFMVYVIMLLDVRDESFVHRYSALLIPGVLVGALIAGGLGVLLASNFATPAVDVQPADFRIQGFSATFLRDYWLHFELASVLLVVAVIGAVTIVQGRRSDDG